MNEKFHRFVTIGNTDKISVYEALRKEEKMVEENEEWTIMTKAADEIGITRSKLSRLAILGRIKTKYNPYDERTRLVNLVELRQMFPARLKYKV